MRIIRNGRHFGLALALLLVTAAGCSGTEKSICDKGRQCLGGNDLDYNACVQKWIYDGKIASDYSCSEAFDTYITCVDTTSTCDTTLGIKNLKNSCNAQASALESCKKAASVKGDDHFLTTQQSVQPVSK